MARVKRTLKPQTPRVNVLSDAQLSVLRLAATTTVMMGDQDKEVTAVLTANNFAEWRWRNFNGLAHKMVLEPTGKGLEALYGVGEKRDDVAYWWAIGIMEARAYKTKIDGAQKRLEHAVKQWLAAKDARDLAGGATPEEVFVDTLNKLAP